jgi:elongator complex protein 1
VSYSTLNNNSFPKIFIFSSFFLHTNYLLATTLTHSLKALPLTQTIFNQKCSAQTFWESESVRSLERGSRLVVAVPESTQTVLQMPRGNLEVVHPRALSLYIVKKLLDNLKYREAMEILRKQRINLNLIVDHNPDLFIENIEKFVEQITDKQRLCLFLADLL